MSKQFKILEKTHKRDKMKKIKNRRYVIQGLKSRKEYHFAGEFGKDKKIMDYGCGPGYGSEILSKYAKKVIGVDIRTKAIDYARRTYQQSNLTFQVISPSKPLPFKEKYFDVIISSHVIEHIPDVNTYLCELKRILKINGKLIISTPNRKFRLLPFQKPYNPYHIREYTPKSLKKELKNNFHTVEIKGVYGTKDVNIIEFKRKKALKNPLKVFFYYPQKIIMKIFKKSEKMLKDKMGNLNMVPSAEIEIKNEFTLKNIFVGDNLKLSSDLLAICHNQ